MMDWSGISQDNIERFWPFIEPLLGPVIDKSPEKYSRDLVKRSLMGGKYQLWLTHTHPSHDNFKLHCALVTEVIGGLCRLQFLGGKHLATSFDLFAKVVLPWAKEKGCDFMTCYPRPGLARLLTRRLGFAYVETTEYGKLFARDLLEQHEKTIH